MKERGNAFSSATTRIAPTFARLDVLEARICMRWNRLGRRPAVRRYFALVSRLGDGIAWYVTLLVLPLVRGQAALVASAHMALTALLGVGIYKSMKRMLARPRPYASCPAVRALVPPLDAGSFPSGHTLHAVSFTIMLGYYEPALLVLVVPFAVSVALSRVLLGLHYPSDVAAGGVIGAALAFCSLGLAAAAGMAPA
jgi:undecaprenyl-diphosphatase